MKNETSEQNKKLPLPLRILIIAIVIVAVILCAAILYDGDDSADAKPSGPVDQTESSDTVDKIENAVLVDNDTIKATFIGTEDAPSLGVFYVTLKIENKTDSEVIINLEDADVDGEAISLITTGVPLAIRSGNSGQAAFIFSMVNLSISTMDDAENATFRIVVRDSGTYGIIYKSDLITVDLH